jgi:hypothetical protein
MAAPSALGGEAAPALSAGAQATGHAAGTPAPATQTPAAASEGTAGMMIYIDPRTGAIVPNPVPGTVPLQLTPQLRESLSTSQQGLIEVPSAVPGGGVRVDLKGRFQHPLIVTIDPETGQRRMHHLGKLPESGVQK